MRNPKGNYINMKYERNGIRGRLPTQEPSNRDKHILEALRDGHSQAEVGRVYGLTRQYVYQIKNRWPHLAPRLKAKLKRKGGSKHELNSTLRSQRSRVPAAERLPSYPATLRMGKSKDR